MTDRDIAKLHGVHGSLAARIEQIFDAMRVLGFEMMVTDTGGVRTTEQQQALYAKGRTAPGPKVTNADGLIKKSNHQPHADGLGHAVDMTFMDQHGTPLDFADDTPSWDERKFPFLLYGHMAKALGAKWGGDWGSLHDLPHVELPDGVPGTGASHA